MATLKDIANALKVSPSLVSKVLNDKMGTSGANEKLIAEIKDTALRLGYQKNLSAAMLQSGRHGSIGVLLHLPGNAGSGIVDQVVSALTKGSSEHKVKLQIRFYEGDAQFETLAKEFNRSTCDGLLVVGIAEPHAAKVLLDRVREKLPLVTVFSKSVAKGILNIDLDYGSISAVLANHLHAIGCRSILCNSSLSVMHQEVSKHLKKLGVQLQYKSFADLPLDFSYESGRIWTEAVLAAGFEFDGLFMACDDQAAAAIVALQKAGKNVPQDVAVVGVDQAPWGAFFPCPISSIHQKFYQRVELGVASLMDLIQGKDVQVLNIAPELRIRESSRRI